MSAAATCALPWPLEEAVDGIVGRSEKISQRLARRIRRQIVEGGLAPGTLLQSEQEMAKQYGVGRASVREALRLLELQGVIKIRSGKGGGPEITRPDGRELAEQLATMLQLQNTKFSALADLVASLAGVEAAMAADTVANHPDHPDIAPFRELSSSDLTANMKDSDFYLALCRDFHELMRVLAGNNVLAVLLTGLSHLYTARALQLRHYHWTPRERRSIHQDHVAIAMAVLAGDSSEAESLATAHMRRQTEYALKAQPFLLDELVDLV
jgi:DNA-binding FadR family transcriptional regulator